MRQKMSIWGLASPKQKTDATLEKKKEKTDTMVNVPSAEETGVEMTNTQAKRKESDEEKTEAKKEKHVTMVEKDLPSENQAEIEAEVELEEEEWGDKGDVVMFDDQKHALQNAHLDFIDNVKEIITRKDIVPKFYEGDLSILLARTTIIVFLTAVITVSKLIFEKLE